MKPLNVRYTSEPKVHFCVPLEHQALCGEFKRLTARLAEVTCKRCQKHIGQLTNIRKVGKS
jgi:hypothetical protein